MSRIGQLAVGNFKIVWGWTAGLCFLRLGACGLHLKHVGHHPLVFSERNGYTHRLQFGNWSLRLLR